MIQLMMEAFSMILTLQSFLAITVGLLIGIAFGALPGLTTAMAMALFVPLTFYMPPLVGIPFLLGLYKGGIYGGSISAILISTPGTAAAAATVLDGYSLAKQGKAGKALKMALYASLFGETLGNLGLLFIAGLLASFALSFGPPEYMAILLFSFTIIATLSGKSLSKGIFSAAVGFFLSVIGIDPQYGTMRFTFGIGEFIGGLSFVPILVGLFAFSEILTFAENRHKKLEVLPISKGEGNHISWAEFKECLPAMWLGSGIGMWIGLLPGLGQPISCWLAYGIAKNRSKNRELFGKGSLEGIAAAEAGNNSVNGTSMIPMLALGIPGDTVTAILLGAFIAQGLRPGPLLFETQGVMVYAILLIMLLGNIPFFLAAYFSIPFFARIATISKGVLIPAICALSVVGSYAVNNSIFDVGLMVVFGVIGYFMHKTDIPISPLIIALLLGEMTETAISQTLILGRGNFSIFLERPIALVFLLITAIIIVKIGYNEIKKFKMSRLES